MIVKIEEKKIETGWRAGQVEKVIELEVGDNILEKGTHSRGYAKLHTIERVTATQAIFDKVRLKRFQATNGTCLDEIGGRTGYSRYQFYFLVTNDKRVQAEAEVELFQLKSRASMAVKTIESVLRSLGPEELKQVIDLANRFTTKAEG